MTMNHKYKKTVIFGRGYMAHRIEQFLQEQGYDAYISPADVTNTAELEQVFFNEKPNLVINAAGKTVIDEVEQHHNRAQAFLVNVGGPANIAYFSRIYSIYCIQLSSGCIFDGQGKNNEGFMENDQPNPGCYYGWTKAWGDWQLMPYLSDQRILILRLRMPLSRYSHPRNLLNKLQQYDNVIDSQNSVTVVEDFLDVMHTLIQKQATGIFHVTNPGTISPYHIVELMKQYGIIPTQKLVRKITKRELDQLTHNSGKARRVNTVLNTGKLERIGIRIKPIDHAAKEAIAHMASEVNHD